MVIHEPAMRRPHNHSLSGISRLLKGDDLVLFLVFILMLGSLFNHFEISVMGYTPRPEHLVIIAVFPFFVANRYLRKSGPLHLDLAAFLIGAWIAVNLVASTLNAPARSESYTHVGRFILLALAYLMVANAPQTAESWERLLKVWILLGTVEALYGLLAAVIAYASGTSLGVDYSVAATGDLSLPRPYGTLFEPNIFGSFTACLYAMFLSIMLLQRGRKQKIVSRDVYLYAGLFLSATATIFTFARASWLSLTIIILLLVVIIGRRFKRMLAYLLVNVPFFTLATLVVLAASGSIVGGRLATLSALDTDTTVQWRLETFRLGVQDWELHPIIGNGSGSFAQLHGQIRGTEAWIPIMVIHTLVDTGLVGLAIQTALLAVVFGRMLKRIRRLPSDSPLKIGLVALAAGMFLLLLAYQSADASWLACFWIQLGLISSGAALVDVSVDD